MLGASPRRAPAPGEDLSGPAPDPRESEESFQRLDPDAQDLVRAGWIEEEVQWERIGRAVRAELGESLLQGATVVGGVQLFLVVVLGMFLQHFTGGVTFGAAIAQLGLAVLAGMALGLLWSRIGAGVLLCALTAMLAVAAVEWVAVGQGWIHGIAFVATVMGGFAGGYVGTRREELPGC